MQLTMRRFWLAVATTLFLGGGALWAFSLPNLQKLASERYGQRTVELVQGWEELISQNRQSSVQSKLKAVNDFFNQRVAWVSDQEAWGAEDYWATPLETMGKEIGDCEDFSIAKYATLLLMGVEPASLRMVYVKLKRSGLTQAHMVLAWYETPASTPQILDNVEYSIMSASDRGDLIPVFSFNGESIWVGSRSQPSSADPLARLSRWRQVLTRMRDEGLNLDL